MTSITEWTFTADVASQINQILRDRPDLPFSEAKVEERGKGSQKRRDLTIYDRENKTVITGEVKMPDKHDGRSPYDEAVVIDAHEKANRIGVEYYFTWNVNKCVLWKTFEQGKSITERYLEPFDALPAPIRKSDELHHPRVKEQINRFLLRFLERCAAIISGAEPMPLLPLDVKFIDVWESGIFPLVAETLHSINDLYESDKRFKNELDKWMRDEQGWTLSNDEEILRDNLERAAKFSCYVLANKIVFYKALRRRYTRLKAMKIPASVKTGAELRSTLEGYFAQAMRATEDYETVFNGDYGDTIPFLSDVAVDGWRALSEQTDAFDFTQINYEVMGQIFERLLSTTERHKFGQHYTRSEVVDLINAFCIQDENASVLDPACGGGTFLVRAYQRKSDLSGGSLTHAEIIDSLYGLDISAYPVHLTTINLATRDLVQQANYPLVARHDFLKSKPGEGVFHVPLGKVGRGAQMSLMELPKVDAVVGNPPYVRQEKINEYYGRAYKKFLQDEVESDAPGVEFSGRSDILCYFFTHGGTFLNNGGYMGLLTSSNWLDTAYGFALQKYFLNNYEIVAILESNCEPWFTGARVTTAATILRKQSNPAKRRANNVKFVWLKRPLEEFLTYAHSEYDRGITFEDLRDRILSLRADEETDAWRVRVVNQGDLYRIGCLSIALSESEEEEDDVEQEDVERNYIANVGLPGVERIAVPVPIDNDYIGYKWGIFLRAPEIFFELLERGGDRFVALGQITDVKRGITSGCDKFFFPRDITDKALSDFPDNREFKEHYGVSRSETKGIRIVRAGDGSQHLIEAKYLEPEVHSLMEIDSIEINPQELARKILLVSEPKERLKGTHVLRYIQWGEREGFDEGSTVQGRINSGRFWYDLTGERRGELLHPKSQQYRHIIPRNTQRLIANCNLYDVQCSDGVQPDLLGAILNSTIVVLNKHQFGRYMGREANLKTEVVDVKMMLVPDPRHATVSVRRKLERAFNSMRQRKTHQLVEVDSHEAGLTGELALEDRQQLDDAVLELLGISNKQERERLRAELYSEITTLYRQLRVAERKMQRFRSATARHGRASAQNIAYEIWEALETPYLYKTPVDFIPKGSRTEKIDLPTGRARIIKGNMFQPDSVEVGETLIELDDPVRCEFVKKLADTGTHGEISIPLQSERCQKALEDYQEYVSQTNDEFAGLAAAYTAEEAMQERVVKELWKRLKIREA
jgi:type I restriction-modification system DNA methylase subunit